MNIFYYIHLTLLCVLLGTIYRNIKRQLSALAFEHPQYSVYQQHNVAAAFVWGVMIGLRLIDPIGVIPTCVTAMQMFSILHPVMDVTQDVQLGGIWYPVPLHPVPIGLVPPGVAHHPLHVVPNPLPRHVRQSVAANVASHWTN